ncbi:dethiobiotin synthase [Parasphingorhabdus cellanae]|uniref:ATP-dependent dethiobiotin synthetase BioD n=1 Tax=Parasphingorhabdus cellanae TaxID=2806553 RepID=A0ABX7SZQ0_9SPHN|nr:dethiobiotin synthase [Parasphingorhabdus cellanae]QTD54766.1 ATP-dependent dethiobiotin synthetase BioD [Parasphingorhabdus cellanae]
MSQKFVITGTDTDIGKTVFAAALTAALNAYYWKPVQAGLDDETDSQAVARLGGISYDRILSENFRLNAPASPHFAAAKDGIRIAADDLNIPQIDGPLVIEGAGGALVPINDTLLYADLFALWECPIIIVASTKLGTINHSLMTIEALRSRSVPIHGIAFIGEEIADSQDTICRIGNVKQLGRLPIIENLSAPVLSAVFHQHFDLTDFAQ